MPLDEPSSHLEPRERAEAAGGLDQLTADRAVPVGAHRISTARHADRVVVLDAGRVVDQGTHLPPRPVPDYADLVSGQVLSTVFR
ncbi:hypothetical protein ABZ499_09820 [Streptomyces sp. NPDC019990]|uniref:hypothetical protein n=1 Tax=Streptomyces sp. NPDC019990 TaxID=3154693 RepID=UPI0033E7BBFC